VRFAELRLRKEIKKSHRLERCSKFYGLKHLFKSFEIWSRTLRTGERSTLLAAEDAADELLQRLQHASRLQYSSENCTAFVVVTEAERYRLRSVVTIYPFSDYIEPLRVHKTSEQLLSEYVVIS